MYVIVSISFSRLREPSVEFENDQDRQNAPGPQYSPEAEASDLVYRHYKDPSEIFLSKPVNKYLKEHHSKYYFNSNVQENTQQGNPVKSNSKKSATSDTYDFTIGRKKSVSDASVGADQIEQVFDDFDQVLREIVTIRSNAKINV